VAVVARGGVLLVVGMAAPMADGGMACVSKLAVHPEGAVLYFSCSALFLFCTFLVLYFAVHPKLGVKKRQFKKPLVGREELGSALIKRAQSQETQ
jgi:hypothetical protein